MSPKLTSSAPSQSPALPKVGLLQDWRCPLIHFLLSFFLNNKVSNKSSVCGGWKQGRLKDKMH